MKLSKKELSNHARDLSDGESKYFHHEECPASHGHRDHKKRLWVKRDGQYITGKCHHCGMSGSYRERNFRKAKASNSTKISSSNDRRTNRDYKIPRDGIRETGHWPREGRIWLYQYGITEQEIQDYGILYSDSCHRLILPVFLSDTLLGYQTRKIFQWDEGPKYLTYRNTNNFWFKSNSLGSGTVVVCEDIISAIKCGRYLDSVALLGSTASDELVLHLSIYKKVLIFMDDDNADIKSKQLKLKKKLELYTEVDIITGVGKDPKECTDRELMNILGVQHEI